MEMSMWKAKKVSNSSSSIHSSFSGTGIIWKSVGCERGEDAVKGEKKIWKLGKEMNAV